jgi:hypothetical protein
VARAGGGAHFLALGGAALGITIALIIPFQWSLSGQPLLVRTTVQAQLAARAFPALAKRDSFCLALWFAILLERPTGFLWAFALGANAFWAAWLFIPTAFRLDP